ncbi:restriction endonuclease [Halegenticoccus soli]|uniref:restriction endonuclease n=1 Tax=Halegenticoccus soli TaxID=1985678 RepID=UPI000C6E2176|nr:restriction endonuclease [Halegenticoccus soli]
MSSEVRTGYAATDDIVRQLRRMDGDSFERFVGDLWHRMGWQTEVSQASRDWVIDVVATRSYPLPETALVGTIRRGDDDPVGAPVVQRYHAMRDMGVVDGADLTVVVTPSTFTRRATVTADRLNVKLVDGEHLARLVHDFDAYHLLKRYAPDPRAVEIPDGAGLDVYPHAAEARTIRGVIGRALRRTLPAGKWQWIVWPSLLSLAMLGGVLVALLAGSEQALFTALAIGVVVWPANALAVYLDRRSTRHVWDPDGRHERLLWVPIGVGVLGAYYLYLRWRYLGLENPATETEAEIGSDRDAEHV